MDKSIVYIQSKFPVLTETFVRTEIRELLRRNINVFVVTLEKNEKLAATCGFGERIIEMPKLNTVEERVICLLEIFKQLNTNYMHTSWATEAWNSSRYFAKRLGVPYGFSSHAADLWLRGNRVEPEQLGEMGRERECVMVATVGNYHRDYLSACGVPWQKIVLTPPPVDRSLLPPRRASFPDKVRNIVTVGRALPKKGFFTAVDAVRLYRSMGEEATLTIIGGGDVDSPTGRQLLEYIAPFDFISATPLLSNDETLKKIAEADVMLLANLVSPLDGDSDGLPTVLAEAMMLGCPVVTTDVASIADLVVNGETGYVVRPGDPLALALALRELNFLLKKNGAEKLLTAAMLKAEKQDGKAVVDTLVSHWQSVGVLK